MMGEAGRTSRCPITLHATVVVVEIAVIAAAAPRTTGIAAVIIIVRVASSWSWVHRLHRDLGSGLSCGVEGLSSGVVLCPELHCGLHSDLGLLSKAMAAVGGRGAAVARGRSAI